MFGKIEGIQCVQVAVLVISAIATATDLSRGKVYNWLTLPAAILGILVSLIFEGGHGFVQSLLGILSGLLLYGWMFHFRFLGGGDVKLLMALGAWGGFHFTVEVALLGVLIGGLFSLGMLILRGRLVSFLKRIYVFLISIFVKELEVHLPKVDQKLTMPFALPISIAAVWILFGQPFALLGIHLW